MNPRLSLLALATSLWSNLAAEAADSPQSIAFRLTEWKSLHFDDEQEAKRQLQLLKKIGCESELKPHTDHTDLRFRASRWSKITLETHEAADEWEKWLKTFGFETLHGHDEAPPKGAIAVHYRMADSQSLHTKDAKQAQEMTAIFTGLGCKVQQAQHTGHIDLTISCSNWRNLIFESHEDAHVVQKWLDSEGFETSHEE